MKQKSKKGSPTPPPKKEKQAEKTKRRNVNLKKAHKDGDLEAVAPQGVPVLDDSGRPPVPSATELAKEIVEKVDIVPMTVKIDCIRVPGTNPRKTFDQEYIKRLSESMHAVGLLEPLVVRLDPKGDPSEMRDRFELVAGECRLKAAEQLAWKEVRVEIRELSDDEAIEVMLIENLQRRNLAPLEEAGALQGLLDMGLKQGALAATLGVSQPWIANRLRLLKAPEELTVLLAENKISSKHVLALLKITEYPKVWKQFWKDIKDDVPGCTVKELAGMIEGIGSLSDDKDLKLVLNIKNPGYTDLPDGRSLTPSHSTNNVWKECKKCKHTIKVEDWQGDKEKICLKTECWREKAGKAIDDVEKSQQQQLDRQMKKLKKANKRSQVVNTDKLKFGTYADFGYGTNIDHKTACKGCENYAKDRDGDRICLDIKCYQQKNNEAQRIKIAKKREQTRRFVSSFDLYLAELGQKFAHFDDLEPEEEESEAEWEYRFYKQQLYWTVRHVWSESAKKAMKFFDKSVRTSEGGIKLADKLSGRQVPQAIMRLHFYQYMQGIYAPDLPELRKRWPEAAAHWKDTKQKPKKKPATKKKNKPWDNCPKCGIKYENAPLIDNKCGHCGYQKGDSLDSKELNVKIISPNSHVWKKMKRPRKDTKCEICDSAEDLRAYRSPYKSQTVCGKCLKKAQKGAK